MIYKSSCHCGQVVFEAEGNLEKIMECNCSICSKRGSLHWFISRENFRLLSHKMNFDCEKRILNI
jgi:hypothetical protein